MTTMIENEYGQKIDFDAACDLMDREISDRLGNGDDMTVRAFFRAYCFAHRQKYGKEFLPNMDAAISS